MFFCFFFVITADRYAFYKPPVKHQTEQNHHWGLAGDSVHMDINSGKKIIMWNKFLYKCRFGNSRWPLRQFPEGTWLVYIATQLQTSKRAKHSKKLALAIVFFLILHSNGWRQSLFYALLLDLNSGSVLFGSIAACTRAQPELLQLLSGQDSKMIHFFAETVFKDLGPLFVFAVKKLRG